jgi:anti-anti-sigma factor
MADPAEPKVPALIPGSAPSAAVPRGRSCGDGLGLPKFGIVADDTQRVRWTDKVAVMTLPELVDAGSADKIRDELLEVIGRGAEVLVVDLTATVACDSAGADAVAHAFQRAAVNGTQLRLAVTDRTVRRALEVSGLDRLVPIYTSLETATSSGSPAVVIPMAGRRASADDDRHEPLGQRPYRAGEPWTQRRPTAVVTPAVLWRLVDALADGVALTDDRGELVLVNRRLAEMFGYTREEIAGKPLESLLPVDMRASHAGYRTSYLRAPRARLMGAGSRLVGLRKDDSTFPVEISLSPVPTATVHFTLAVVRDMTEVRRREDLADLARAAVEVGRVRGAEELLGRVAESLFDVGLSLERAIDLPHDEVRERIAAAVEQLDLTILQIRDHVFGTRRSETPPEARR